MNLYYVLNCNLLTEFESLGYVGTFAWLLMSIITLKLFVMLRLEDFLFEWINNPINRAVFEINCAQDNLNFNHYSGPLKAIKCHLSDLSAYFSLSWALIKSALWPMSNRGQWTLICYIVWLLLDLSPLLSSFQLLCVKLSHSFTWQWNGLKATIIAITISLSPFFSLTLSLQSLHYVTAQSKLSSVFLWIDRKHSCGKK